MNILDNTRFSRIKGFNYQPSYGRNGFEIWTQFDAGIVRKELERGRRYFPKMNAIRLWLDFHAWQVAPKVFLKNVLTAIGIAARLDLKVMPVLFNRWHQPMLAAVARHGVGSL